MTRSPFPVLHERTLGAPGRRRMRAWRAPAELPDRPPGSVLVFRAGDRFEVVDGEHVHSRDEIVLDATSVSVVDVRARKVEAEMALTSVGQAMVFPVVVSFVAEVVDAAAVARQGLIDLGAVLSGVLCRDPELLALHDRFEVDEVVAARSAVSAYVVSAYGQQPPAVDGVRIRFEGVRIETPDPLRQHRRAVQDAAWTEQLDEQTRGYEIKRFDHVAAFMASPEDMQIAAVTRGETSLADAARDGFERREALIERLTAQVEAFEQSGEAARDPVDRRALLDTLDQLLIGVHAPRQPTTRDQRPSLPAGGDERRDDELPDYIPHDDDDRH